MTVDTLSLEDKVAIVTGSGRENGIGAGIALALARNGASVVINYVSESSATRAENVAESLRRVGGNVIVVQASVDTLEGARHLVQKTLEGFQTDYIDILGKHSRGGLLPRFSLPCSDIRAYFNSVNNAGVGFLSPVLNEINPVEANKTYQVNANGPLYMVNSVVPHMPPGGRIINVSSTNAKLVNPIVSTYSASKAALDNLTVSWAEEVCSPIVVSASCPSSC
jgi:NAD(P)-dependent dehydrogenase (short-subunit alcohol dehydrogenase family)